MGMLVPIFEHKADDLFELAGSVGKIDSIAGIALVLAVIACMSDCYYHKADLRERERGVIVAGERACRAVRDEDRWKFGSIDCPIQSYVRTERPDGLRRGWGVTWIPNSDCQRCA